MPTTSICVKFNSRRRSLLTISCNFYILNSVCLIFLLFIQVLQIYTRGLLTLWIIRFRFLHEEIHKTHCKRYRRFERAGNCVLRQRKLCHSQIYVIQNNKKYNGKIDLRFGFGYSSRHEHTLDPIYRSGVLNMYQIWIFEMNETKYGKWILVSFFVRIRTNEIVYTYLNQELCTFEEI